MDREEELLWLVLQHLCGGRSAQLRKLQGIESSPAKILQVKNSRWRRAGVSADILLNRAAWRRLGAAHPAQQQALCDQSMMRALVAQMLACNRPGYPPLLAQIPDPPPLLYVVGRPELLSEAQLAIVGSRKTSAVGRRAAAEMAADMVDSGLTITSGLALGIDAAAHQAALGAGGETVAVIATGIDRVYPARHRGLAGLIAERGVLVSEFPLGTSPRRENFPKRNRLISGLSLGVLVVEAAMRSGSLITARLALEQNREVFALPHSIYHPGGRGCNELLRQGAKLVECRDDILQELGPLFQAGRMLAERGQAERDQAEHPELPDALAGLYKQLGYEPVTIAELVGHSGLESQQVLAALTELQLRGLVEQSQGRYMKS